MASVLFLNTPRYSLDRAGVPTRSACGAITLRSITPRDRPRASDASHCPRTTEASEPRTISAMKAAVYSEMPTSKAANSGDIDTIPCTSRPSTWGHRKMPRFDASNQPPGALSDAAGNARKRPYQNTMCNSTGMLRISST